MADLEMFDNEHQERSHHSYRIQRRERQEADGEVKVDVIIEEVEIRTNFKHLSMSQTRAAELPQTASASLWRTLDGKETSRHATDWRAVNDLFGKQRQRGPTEQTVERFSGGNVSALSDEQSESDEDCWGNDLIDIINNSGRHGDGWTKTSESPVRDVDGDKSPLTHSYVLLSDGFESDAESAELLICSDSEDEPLDLTSQQSVGRSKSPELTFTPLTSTPSLFRSQDPSPAGIGGAKAGWEAAVIGRSREESAQAGSDSEGLIVVGSEAEGHRDGDLSDGDDSVCSMASGPSKPTVYQGLCARCLDLHMRMKRLASWTKSRVKDPACLYYDQWRLLKPWRPRGRHGYRREKGKLFKHLSLIWRRAEARAKGDPEDECDSCTRPHVFLQRNLQRCQRARSKVLEHTQVKKKARSRQRRRSSYPLPPLYRSAVVKRKCKVSSTEDSAKKKKTSIAEEHERKEEHGRSTRGRRRRHQETRRTDKQGRRGRQPTSDCSAEENDANPSPDACTDTTTDTDATQGNLDAPSHAEGQADATAESRSPAQAPRPARNARGTRQNGQEDRPVNNKTGQGRDKHVDGHGAHSRVDQHTGVGTCKNPAGWSPVRQPLISLPKCNSVDENVHTGKDMEPNRQASRIPAGYTQKRTEDCTDSEVSVKANRYGGDQDIFVNNAKRRQTKSHKGTVLNGHSKVGSSIRLNRPPHTNGSNVLDGCHLDRTEGCDDTGRIQRVLPFNGGPKKVPPTTPIVGFSKVTRAARTAKRKGQVTEPLCEEKEEEKEDPYAFRTPTPPEVHTSEVVRKLRPFARTYETPGTKPKPDTFRSMLCSLDRSRGAVVREKDP